MAVAMVGAFASVGVAAGGAERGAVRQPTYANLVGPLVARAGGFVTLRGSIGIRGTNGHVSSGYVLVQSRPARMAKWRTLTRLALKSDGTFLFKTRVGATGAQGVRNVFFRVVFAGDARHGPSSQDCTTEVVMPSTQPPPPAPPTATAPATVPVPISPVTGVSTGWPVTALTADGGRVAYATCAGVFTWDTTAAQATQVATARLSNNCVPYLTHWGVSSVALAGDQLAYVDVQGGNIIFWSVVSVSLGAAPQPTVLASGSQTNGPPHPQAAWSGGLLALSSEVQEFPLVWHIQTMGPSGCPCQEILRFPQPYPDLHRHLNDADDGRLVVSGGGLLRVLDTNGNVLLTLPVESSYSALSGDDLVVQLDSELRDYSVATGTLVHTWRLAASTQQAFAPVLQDVARGLAAYTVDGQLHLLRLGDGSDAIIAPADLARFADTGLVLAAGTRIQLIPYGELPLH
jgi:hypothetical protein